MRLTYRKNTDLLQNICHTVRKLTFGFEVMKSVISFLY